MLSGLAVTSWKNTKRISFNIQLKCTNFGYKISLLLGYKMKNYKYFLLLPLIISFSSCHSDLVTKKYEPTILKNAVSFSIPQFQNNEEIELIKTHKVKSISYISFDNDSTDIDSLTFIEYDLNGRILRRTTKENTTQGCLPYMIRQEFTYEGDRIKKVTDYTFKNVANSTLENWLLRDTTMLLLFDWEDYSYSGDTITVESGGLIHTYIKDQKGDVIKRTTMTKSDKKLHNYEYEFNDESVVERFDSPSYADIQTFNYFVDKNLVFDIYSTNDKEYTTEYVFDEKGLIKSKTYYVNEKKERFIVANYSYY
jgi:hypothetical protein